MLESILASVLSGGLSGILGAALQRFADYKNKQLDMAIERQRGDQELAKRRIDKEITESEYAGRLRVAQVEGETSRDVADSQAFGQSLFREPERYSQGTFTTGQMWVLVILDFARGITRPLLTLYLCALTTYIWWQVRQLLSLEDLDPDRVLEVWKLVVNTILYLTTTCILWWFGVRNKQPQPGTRSS